MTTNFVESKTLAELATLVSGQVKGNPDYQITGVATLMAATNEDISFLTNAAYRNDLRATKAGAVILTESDVKDCDTNAIITPNPHAAYAKVASLCLNSAGTSSQRIAESASIAAGAKVSDTAIIKDYVTVGEGTTIGENTVIEAGVVIGSHVTIGNNCHIYPHTTLYNEVKLGNNVVIHANTVIGSDGFGFAFENGSWIKVPQLGSVRIHDDVEIGAHTTIDCGAIDDTIIEQGVKIDNQVQVGHNCVIGAYTVVAGTAAFAGSSKIGRYCLIGGGATFAGHITVCDQVQIAGMTTVTRSITKPGTYSSGTGMMPANKWRKSVVHFRNLDDMAKRIRSLEKLLDDK